VALVGLLLLAPAVSALTACGPERPKQVVHVTQYNGGKGVPLYVSTDASKLAGAPKDFKAFIRGKVRAAFEADDGSCGEPPVYSVLTVSDTGYAGGDFSECGVRHVVWAKVNGKWSEVLTYKSDPQCAALKSHEVPPGITGDSCRDADGRRPYQG
jgi:hypothetical protein